MCGLCLIRTPYYNPPPLTPTEPPEFIGVEPTLGSVTRCRPVLIWVLEHVSAGLVNSGETHKCPLQELLYFNQFLSQVVHPLHTFTLRHYLGYHSFTFSKF